MRVSFKKVLVESAWAICLLTLVWQQAMIWTMQLSDERLEEVYFRIAAIDRRLDSVVVITPLNCEPVEDGDDDQVFIERVAGIVK